MELPWCLLCPNHWQAPKLRRSCRGFVEAEGYGYLLQVAVGRRHPPEFLSFLFVRRVFQPLRVRLPHWASSIAETFRRFGTLQKQWYASGLVRGVDVSRVCGTHASGPKDPDRFVGGCVCSNADDEKAKTIPALSSARPAILDVAFPAMAGFIVQTPPSWKLAPCEPRSKGLQSLEC